MPNPVTVRLDEYIETIRAICAEHGLSYTELIKLALDNYIKDIENAESWASQRTKEVAEEEAERRVYNEMRKKRKLRGTEIIYAGKNLAKRLDAVDESGMPEHEKGSMKAEIISEQQKATEMAKRIVYGRNVQTKEWFKDRIKAAKGAGAGTSAFRDGLRKENQSKNLGLQKEIEHQQLPQQLFHFKCKCGFEWDTYTFGKTGLLNNVCRNCGAFCTSRVKK